VEKAGDDILPILGKYLGKYLGKILGEHWKINWKDTMWNRTEFDAPLSCLRCVAFAKDLANELMFELMICLVDLHRDDIKCGTV
jgi:hypothetical protein